MKKIIISICLYFCIISLKVCADSQYVIARLIYRPEENKLYELNIPFDIGYTKKYEENSNLNIIYFTKEECKNKVMNYSISYAIENTVVEVDTDMGYVYVLMCVPTNLWNNLNADVARLQKSKGYNENYRKIYKNSEQFISEMKKCGLREITPNHIPLPSTPFLCDIYNEKNMIPVKKWSELID